MEKRPEELVNLNELDFIKFDSVLSETEENDSVEPQTTAEQQNSEEERENKENEKPLINVQSLKRLAEEEELDDEDLIEDKLNKKKKNAQTNLEESSFYYFTDLIKNYESGILKMIQSDHNDTNSNIRDIINKAVAMVKNKCQKTAIVVRFPNPVTPWLSTPLVGDWLNRFENEIQLFVKWCELTEEEKFIRNYVTDKITKIIQKIYPKCEVFKFGSFATGLSTYMSDIDLSVTVNENNVSKASIFKIATLLKESNLVISAEPLVNARVPIIKAKSAVSGIDIDISFNTENGKQHTKTAYDYLAEVPEARILILILKAFLRQRHLHMPFTGGVGGYCLFQMVRSFLTTRDYIFPYEIQEPLKHAQIVMEFFEFYGTLYRHSEFEISCSSISHLRPVSITPCYKKRQSSERRYLENGKVPVLSVIDPQDKHKDIGGGAFNYEKIHQAFELAYLQLLTTYGEPIAIILSKKNNDKIKEISEEEKYKMAIQKLKLTVEGNRDFSFLGFGSILGSIIKADPFGVMTRIDCFRAYKSLEAKEKEETL